MFWCNCNSLSLRVKLAGWLASKGKTLKRPAMTETSAPQTCKPQLHTEEGDGAPPEASKRAEAVTVSKAEQSQVPQWKPAFSNSPSHILNTTLDLLDNSDTELQAEPEIKMESVIHSNIHTQYIHKLWPKWRAVHYSVTLYALHAVFIWEVLLHTVISKHLQVEEERGWGGVLFVSDLSSNDSPDIRFFWLSIFFLILNVQEGVKWKSYFIIICIFI